MRRALKASLATLDRVSGYPYASLVTVATEPDGTPVLLISRLALHTQNILADPRASLMIDGTSATGDPLAGGRVTVLGRVQPPKTAHARHRFLARHPAAEMYVDFPDFAFFELAVESAHFIGGFGRIVDLSPNELLIDLAGAEKLVDAEIDIISHMNSDHADAVALYAAHEAGSSALATGCWRMTGLDPEGADLVGDGQSIRMEFGERVENPGDARRVLARLAAAGRQRGGG